MASSPLNTKSHFHARSNSLPTRPHPLVSQIHEHLSRLRVINATSSSSSSILSNKLSGIRDLYDLVDGLLQLPHTQKALAQECNENQVDEVLNGSLKLLDVCGTYKDFMFQTKECVQKLQLILRRRKGDEFGIANEIAKYLTSRKKAMKDKRKSLKYLKSKCYNSPLEYNNSMATISLLREVEEVTRTALESLMSYVSGAKLKSKPSRLSLVSKLMHSKHVAVEEDATEVNEFEKADAGLCTLISHKTRKSNKMSAENVHMVLSEFESSVQDLEEGLDCLLRRLIKTRVSLLNIISN